MGKCLKCGPFLDRHWGWVVTISSFLMYFVNGGCVGVFVLLYVYFEREFQDSAVATGWIGSLTNGLVNLMSFVSSPLYERFTRRKVIAAGVILSSTGILATSFCQALWQIYLTFGILFAIGYNFLSNPSVNMMTLYFPGRNCVRSTAFGCSGQSVGVLVITPLCEALLSLIGWRKTLQIYAAVTFATCLPLAMVFRPPPPPAVKLGDEEDLSMAEGQKRKVTSLIGSTPQTELDDRDEQADGDVSELKVSDFQEETSPGDGRQSGSEDFGATAGSGNSEAQESEMGAFLETKDEDSELAGVTPSSLRPKADGPQVPVGKAEKMPEKLGKNKDERLWRKYIELMKEPKHWCFFVGMMGAAISIYFNGINLVSCMVIGGIPEATAAWMVTVLSVADILSRLFLALTDDSLPVKRILLLAIAAGVGGASSFLLTRGTSLWIFVIYCIFAGCARGLVFILGVAYAVEYFGANRAVETLTSLQVARGIGGLLASSIAGLSYDFTGSYQTMHYTCAALWTVSCLLFFTLYKWRQIPSCRSKATNYIRP